MADPIPNGFLLSCADGLRRAARLPVLFLLLPAWGACSGERDAQAIIDRSIEAHGGAVFERSVVDFDLRGRHYRATRDGGRFVYERTYTDSTGRLLHDVMTNDSLYREVDGQRSPLSAEQRASIESGTNSTIYFALLPYKLNDPAAQKRYLGETAIEGKAYHEIEVTFEQEGGGQDFDDRFVYWINQETYTMDFLAYRFHVDGGGTRFREAVNPRVVGGLLFTDHLNYTSDEIGTAIEDFDRVREAGRLTKLSEIILEDISVRPLPAPVN